MSILKRHFLPNVYRARTIHADKKTISSRSFLCLLSNDVQKTKEHLLKTSKPGAGAAARIFPFVPVDVTEVIILKSPAKP